MIMVVIEMSIGNKISYMRSRFNLTQDQLAKKIGISRSALSHYEKDRRDPDYETLNRLADFFEVTTDYLLGRKTSSTRIEGTEQSRKLAIINKIATEFPDMDLMFNDIKNWTSEDFEELYDYIKFKKSQKENK